ncbi:MAG: hypothetical protein MRY63_02440 [Neomegalonema sp.]|nr:hypothetical protein [Neomegalonema sp.]
MSPFRVSAIGSCRIHTPLRQMSARHWFDFNNRRSFGFTHTTKEALQQARFLMEDYDVPEELIPFICPNKTFEALVEKKHPKSDLYVLEICSGKEFSYEGHSVQLNYMKVYYKQLFKNTDWSVPFWSSVKANDFEERNRLLEQNPLFQKLDGFDQEFLRGVQLSSVTRESVWEDLAILKDMLGEILLVTHFDARTEAGNRLPDRSALIKLTHEAGAAFNLPVYDPTPLMESAGQENALDDNGRDLTHYAPDFTEVVGQQMFDLYIGARMEMHREGEDNRVAEIGQPFTGLAPDFWAEIEQNLKNNEYRYVEAALRDRLSMLPGDALANAGLGLALHKSGDKEDALEPFQLAMAAGPMAPDHAVVAMKNFYHNKRYADAAALARGLLVQDTDQVDAHYTMARLANRVNNTRLALDHWLMLASIVPKDVEPQLQLMRIYARMKNDTEAQKRVDKVLDIDPSNLEALQLRSKLAVERGDQASALESAAALASSEPETALALMQEIVFTGKVDTAAEFAEEIFNAVPVELAPDRDAFSAQALSAALLAEENGDDEIALNLHRVALRVAPQSASAARARKQLIGDRLKAIQPLSDSEAWSELVALAQGVLADDPAATKASIHGGRALMKLGRDEEAFQMLSAATGYESDNGWLWLNVARAAMITGRLSEADFAYAQVQAYPVEGKPQFDEEAQAKRAELSKLAVEAGKKALQSDDYEQAFESAVVLRRSGEKFAAEAIADKAHKSYKKHLQALYKTDLPAALAQAQKVLAVDPENATAHLFAGRVLSKVKRYHEARDHWQLLTTMEPDVSKHWVQLAKCHKNLKDWDECANAAQQALRIDADEAEAAELLERANMEMTPAA